MVNTRRLNREFFVPSPKERYNVSPAFIANALEKDRISSTGRKIPKCVAHAKGWFTPYHTVPQLSLGKRSGKHRFLVCHLNIYQTTLRPPLPSHPLYHHNAFAIYRSCSLSPHLRRGCGRGGAVAARFGTHSPASPAPDPSTAS